jgi:ATP-binding cassette subfamily F protein uup
MDHLVDQLLIFEGDGKIRRFNGNYSDYRDWLEQQESIKIDTPVKEVIIEKPAEDQKRKLSYKEKQEYDRLQQEIDQLEKKKEELTGLLTVGSVDHHQLQEWAEQIQHIADAVDNKTLRWLELSEFV